MTNINLNILKNFKKKKKTFNIYKNNTSTFIFIDLILINYNSIITILISYKTIYKLK